ncbi:MAG: putative serine/threonine kinase anti-sigma factor [Frankiales bacterium]|jgi:serine/threonine-protein kinase RsbW|nr:putative serine/threonine kinase anti-sigma factor [Frankiales bacterium]
MEIKLTLALPRDELSVPVVRRVLKASMQALGVTGDVIGDIELALTEAVTNVLDHATEGDEYEVSAGIDGDLCVIEVIDRGDGFDSSVLGRDDAHVDAEGGRGIQLMRALVDKVTFDNVPRVGTVVHLEKKLEWHENAAIKRLTEDSAPTEHGPWTKDEHLDDAPEPEQPRR